MIRYFLSWQSSKVYDRLEAAAKANGTYTEDSDDWYEPEDLEVQRDAGETLPGARRLARGALEDAYFGTVTIMERIADDEIPGSYDTRVVEDVEAT